MIDRLAKLLSTFFYTGEFPFAPGTLGSFAGLLLYVALSPSLVLLIAVFFIVLAAGFFSAGRAEKIFEKKDPHEVVIDEVCGIFLVFMHIPLSWVNIAAGFLLFRLLDITKPFPVRRLEKLPGSLGIMIDDIVCGLYANFILLILLKYNVLKV